MGTVLSDTHPKAEEIQLRLLRQAPAWRKLEMLSRLNVAARWLSLAGIKKRFPNADEGQIRYQQARILLGDELADKLYGSGQKYAA